MYLYKEIKENKKQPGIVSKQKPLVFCSSSTLYDVRIKYKSGRPEVPNTMMTLSKHSDRTGSRPVLQRIIMVANHDLSGFDDAYILGQCVKKGLKRTAQRCYSLKLDDGDFIQWIGKMKNADGLFCAGSYAEFNKILCQFILSNMPQRKVPKNFSSEVSFHPFSAGDMGHTLPDLKSEDLYRPSSPVVTVNEDRRRVRTENSLGFRIAAGERHYHVGGSGRFMAGVGSYSSLLSDGEVLVRELNALFSGTKTFSSYKAANDLYALIIGVEGCARSAHNIALARIFFENYYAIKENYPDKSLFELAEMFLTFVKKGGASLSKHYAENLNELQMLLSHCSANNIPFTVKDISEYLITVVEDTIRISHLETIYPLYCEETFKAIAKALREGSLLSRATDEEIQKFIEKNAINEKSEQHTLYDWETIAGVWYINYFLDKRYS